MSISLLYALILRVVIEPSGSYKLTLPNSLTGKKCESKKIHLRFRRGLCPVLWMLSSEVKW